MIRYALCTVGATVSFGGVLPGIPVAYWAWGLPAALILGVVSAYACWVCLGWMETTWHELERERRRQMPRSRGLLDWEGGL